MKRFGPSLLATLVMVSAFVAVAPWGNYPLNDDWMYAHVTKHLAETGEYRLDIGFAPSLIGQSLLVVPVIRAFGFSNLALRLVTMLLALAGLWAADALLRGFRVNTRIRCLALATLALSPLYLYFSTTFMTEVYGLVPALFGAALWFWDRQRKDLAGRHEVIGWGTSIGVGALIGATCWVRQFAILAYPPLLLATLLRVKRGGRERLRASWKPLLAGLAVFCACVASQWVWARVTGRTTQAFKNNLALWDHLGQKQYRQNWALEPGALVVYMGALLAPLLVTAPWRRMRWGGAAVSAGVVAFAVVSHFLFAKIGFNDFGSRTMWHTHFPYIGNVLFNAGIGPINTALMYWADKPAPMHWSAGTWSIIEWGAIALGLGWGAVHTGAVRLARAGAESVEGVVFGVVFAALSFFATLLIADPWTHDRYLFPSFLGLWLAAAIVSGATGEPEGGPRWLRAAKGVVAVAACLGLSFYSVGGVHDQFRWNDARWGMVNGWLAKGVDPNTIQAGYEVDGWLRYEVAQNLRPQGCVGFCRCSAPAWWCIDDSRRVDFFLLNGYRQVEAIQPKYWLADGPPLLAMERER